MLCIPVERALRTRSIAKPRHATHSVLNVVGRACANLREKVPEALDQVLALFDERKVSESSQQNKQKKKTDSSPPLTSLLMCPSALYLDREAGSSHVARMGKTCFGEHKSIPCARAVYLENKKYQPASSCTWGGARARIRCRACPQRRA